MDRRFILWLSVSLLLILLLGKRPEPPKPDAKAKQAENQLDDAQAAKEEKEGEQNGNAKDESASEDPQAEQEPEVEVAAEKLTLGSVDETSDYRMLVTLTNEGAGVERIELASPRYLDLTDRGGYLGHLALEPAEQGDGLKVQVVGAGTPAAEAGIEVGDRLIAAGTKELKPIESVEAFGKLLAITKPGRELKLTIERDGGEQDVTVKLVRRPLEVIRPEKENVLLWADKLPAGSSSPPSFQMTLEQIDRRTLAGLNEKRAEDELPKLSEFPELELRQVPWEISDKSEDSVTFRRRSSELGLTFVKRYRLEETPEGMNSSADYPAYHLTLELSIENTGDEAREIAYQLDGPNGLPIEGWWYAYKVGHDWGAVGLRDVMTRTFDAKVQQFAPATIATDGVEPLEGSPLAFVGVDAQYFSAMMIPDRDDAEELWIERTEFISLSPEPKKRGSEGKYVNATCRLVSVPKSLGVGKTRTEKYTLFAGPKRPELLEQYQAVNSPIYSLADLITYGWFTRIAKGMLWILHFFYGLVGNYGISIILLTVLVRSCMFPISRKQAHSMAKMQELRPEMDRIKEKYKGDMQKQSQATQELYRKHGVNPLAGCLPMLIQLPVFVGLYRGLAVDIELRQASLFGDSVRWCSNLAAPDMFWDWSAFMPEFINRGEGFFGLGPYLNVLPLITIVLYLLQQKLFMPPPANEQAELQQKIMKYMMVFMGLLFYKVPSGLCLYFIASSAWGIAERMLLPKPTPPAEGAASKVSTDAPSFGDSDRSKKDKKKRPKNGGNRGNKKRKR